MIISQLPELFVQRERALLGPRFDAMFSYPGQGAVRGASVNALRCTPQQFAALADFPLEASPFCASAFVVPQPDWKPGRHPYHHAGAFYAQEPSASAPAALLDVHPGMRVADLCAAPGGKTSQLAAALAGQGVLLANEFVAARAEVLRQNLERMGVTNAIVTNEDTARLAAAYPGQFDRILVDAPCSGEGMFRKESVAVTQYDQPLLDRCAALGAEILENAAAMLAPGGILVYSTCTFAPGEDEGQIAAFLARHPEFTLCDLSGCGFGQPGEGNRTGDYPLQAEYCRRIWPCDGGEGHFMAKLQKAADAPAVELPRGKNGKGKGGKTPRVDAKALQAWQSFAKELFPTLAGQPMAVVGDGFLLEPPALLPAAKLHWILADKNETIVAEPKNGKLIIHSDPANVLANEPPFDYQMQNLNNYMALSPHPPENSFSPALPLKSYSRGMGALGLPGDLSSQSRFVRAAFVSANSVSGNGEYDGITQLFHILGSVEQQNGCCITENGGLEKTIYTACFDAQSGVYYYTTYENRQITAIDMFKANLNAAELACYPMLNTPQIKFQN